MDASVEGVRYARSAARWGLAAAFVLFVWALASEVSLVWPTTFQATVRIGNGAQNFSSSFSLAWPDFNLQAIFACSVLIAAVLELEVKGKGRLWAAAVALPPIAIVCDALLPRLLFPSSAMSAPLVLALGVIGVVPGMGYIVLHCGDVLGTPPERMLSSILVLLVGSAAVVYLISALTWVIDGAYGGVPLVGSAWFASDLSLRLLNQPYYLMPELIVLLFVSWLVRAILARYWGALREAVARLSLHFAPAGEWKRSWLDSPTLPGVLAFIAIACSLFVGLYPYLPAINIHGVIVGYDVRTTYYPFLKQMLGESPQAAVGYALTNDRTGFLILDYLIGLVTGSAGVTVKAAPVLLSVVFTSATYLFVRAASRDRLLAATGALFSAFSILTVSGINGGFYADWLAMSEALVLFALLFLGLERTDRRYIALSAVASVALLYTHPWTWAAIAGVLAAYALLTALRSFYARDTRGLGFELVSVGAVILVDLGTDLSKHLLGGLSGTLDVVTSTSGSLAISNAPTVLGSLASTLRYFLGGALENSLVVVLAIVGVVTLPGFGSRLSRLLVSWMAVTSGGVFLYGYSLNFFQARMIMLAPLQVLSAMGFLALLRYFAGVMSAESAGDRRLVDAFVVLAFVAVTGAMVGVALRNVGILYTGT